MNQYYDKLWMREKSFKMLIFNGNDFGRKKTSLENARDISNLQLLSNTFFM